MTLIYTLINIKVFTLTNICSSLKNNFEKNCFQICLKPAFLKLRMKVHTIRLFIVILSLISFLFKDFINFDSDLLCNISKISPTLKQS